MSSLGNLNEKLSKLVCNETYKDIEDFLTPSFNADTTGGKDKRHVWRIVRDGHGRWREIKPCIDTEEKDEITSRSGSNRTRFTPNNELLFSNNILNSVKSPSISNGKSRNSTSCFLALPRRDYSYLSTTTRSNIFPGVGNYDWHSQSNAVYTESALNLGKQRGLDLRDEFYGITRDEMGAWNEASVHHERMKKSWEAYLESLAKVDKVVTKLQTNNGKHAELKIHKIDPKPKKTKKRTKKADKKITQRNDEEHLTEQKEYIINTQNEQVAPKFSKSVAEDDDFWDFYEQPFVKP